MARIDKVKEAFDSCTGPFPYAEFKWLIQRLGYEEVRTRGKTGGSRRRFYNADLNDVVTLHEPHDGEMKPYMVRLQQAHLRDKGLL